jgi:DNA-binding transcriptional MerR regulator
MSKAELAAEFGVHIDTLMRWIKNNEKLLSQLKKTGYFSRQRIFTPKQVQLIHSKFS